MTPAAKPDYVAARLLKIQSYHACIDTSEDDCFLLKVIEQYERQREELRVLCEEARACHDIRISAEWRLIQPEEIERIMAFDAPANTTSQPAQTEEMK